MARMALARVLVLLGIILAVAAVVAGYVRYQALDTPTVAKTADELIADDEIRNQVAARLVEQLFANVDVQAELEERLPPDQKARRSPSPRRCASSQTGSAQRLLARPRFQALWASSIVRAHEQLVRLLDDDLTSVSTEERSRRARSPAAVAPARRSGRGLRQPRPAAARRRRGAWRSCRQTSSRPHRT